MRKQVVVVASSGLAGLRDIHQGNVSGLAVFRNMGRSGDVPCDAGQVNLLHITNGPKFLGAGVWKFVICFLFT